MSGTLGPFEVDASHWPDYLTVSVTLVGDDHSDRQTHATATPGEGLSLHVTGGSGWGCLADNWFELTDRPDHPDDPGVVCCSMLTVEQIRQLLRVLSEALDWALAGVDPSIAEVTQ